METEDEIVLKAVAVVNAMIDDDSIGNSLKIAGDFFTPEQLALVTALLAGSRRDLQFDFTHSNQDPDVFALVIRTQPQPKFVSFPFRDAAERKKLVEELLTLPQTPLRT